MQSCVIVTAADAGFLPAACCTLISTKDRLPANLQVTRLLLAVDVSETEVARANDFLQSSGIEPCVTGIQSHALHADGFRVREPLPVAAYTVLALDQLISGKPDKVLYLDADTRIMSPLDNLLQTELSDYPIAAVHDVFFYVRDRLADKNRGLERPADTNYFNSGVVLFNWPVVLKQGILAKARDFAGRHPEKCTSCDQDALNAVVAGQYLPLDPRWNLMHYYVANGGKQTAWIKHFTGPKPWTRWRPSVWADDTLWYKQLLGVSPWSNFVKHQTRLDRLRMRQQRCNTLIRNYRRQLAASLFPSLMKPAALKRAEISKAFYPGQVVSINNAWMKLSSTEHGQLKPDLNPDTGHGPPER